MLFTLRRKILFGYGVSLLLIAVVLAWAVANILTLGRASDAILRENYRSILAAWHMLATVERQNDTVFLLLQTPGQMDSESFRSGEVEFLQWLGRARDNITIPGEDRIIADIDSSYARYLASVNRTLADSRDDPTGAAVYYREAVVPALNDVLESCHRLRDINQNTMYQASARAQRISGRAVASTLAVGLAALLIGFLFSFFLSNFVTRPLAHFMEAARTIATGNYSVRISVHSSDELGLLAGEFNTMAEKLRVFRDMDVERLVSEKNKSEAIIRSIDDGLLYIGADMRIIGINPATSRVLHTTPAEAEGRHFLEIVRDDTLFQYIRRAGETGLPPEIEEDRNVLTLESEEGRRHYLFSITPVSTVPGPASGVLLLLRDITRLKELDLLKSQFVMTASHELRTPLTSALMSIELLTEKAGERLTGQELQLLGAAREEMHRLRALVNDLLELSKIESGKIEMQFEPVSLRMLAEKAVIPLKPQAAERGVEMTAQLQDNLPMVKADPGKIAWVLTNLISNALRYTDPGGSVKVLAERFGSQVHVSVRDTGTGIPLEYQSRIFDKFVQVKNGRESGGSGLGLAISKEIVRAHGGTIWVDSAPGEGSTFTFTLPVAPASGKEET